MKHRIMYRNVRILLALSMFFVLAGCGSSDEEPPEPQTDQTMLQATIDALQATVDASDAADDTSLASVEPSRATDITAQPTERAIGLAGLWYSEPGENRLQRFLLLDGHGEFFTWHVEAGETEVPYGGSYDQSSDDLLMLQTPSTEPLEIRLVVEETNADRGHLSGMLGDFDISRTRLAHEEKARLEGIWMAGREYQVEFGMESFGGLFGLTGDYIYEAFADGTFGIFAAGNGDGFAMLCHIDFFGDDTLVFLCPVSDLPQVEILLEKYGSYPRSCDVPELSNLPEQSPQVANNSDELAQAGDRVMINTPISLELVKIPAGEFIMGSNPGRDGWSDSYEEPQCSISLDTFFIGRYEVTNDQYAAFVRDTVRTPPLLWEGGVIPPGKENHPVVYVSWQDAVEYTQWLSQATDIPFRLCTEAEWEKAARGSDSRIYPWGDDYDAGKCHCDVNDVQDIALGTASVGMYSPSGDSPYGVADMAGNVLEWTSSLFRPYPFNANDGRENYDTVGHRVLRGGAYNSSGVYWTRSANRFTAVNTANEGEFYFGFRVCASP